MKKFQALATTICIAALSGAIAFSATNSAEACFFSKSAGAKSSNGSTSLGSGADKINPWNHAAIAFGGIAAILGLGAGYMSFQAGQQAKAACAAMTDSFDDIDEFEDAIGDELVCNHPEAPGGGLDLVVVEETRM
ncbi:hypothetical protein BCD67_02595 [Oscillatoriales cyanobacterium USR001]|nr:hypothetical protein BCD67_02595 [Oscillatoriales cyanobacterium USR001]